MKGIKKITAVGMNVLLSLFLAIAIITVALTVFSKKDTDGVAKLLGYQMRIVTSDSMAACEYTDVSDFPIKAIPRRSMVFVKIMPQDTLEAEEWYRSLRVGDVLTFRYVYTTQVTITHRIIAITEKATGGFLIELAADNRNSEAGQLVQIIDTAIPQNTNYVIGRVVGQSYLLGVILSFLMQPVGMVLVIILPCVLIIALEVAKIVKTVTADKTQKEQDEKAERERELAALRRRLATLEQEKRDMNAVQAVVERPKGMEE